jgi:hypothetical protein
MSITGPCRASLRLFKMAPGHFVSSRAMVIVSAGDAANLLASMDVVNTPLGQEDWLPTDARRNLDLAMVTLTKR